MRSLREHEGRREVAVDSFAHETIAVSNVAKGLTVATFSPASGPGAQGAIIAVEGNDVRFWTDGTDPTATVGVLAVVGATITLNGQNDLRGFRVIRKTLDATLSVIYLR